MRVARTVTQYMFNSLWYVARLTVWVARTSDEVLVAMIKSRSRWNSAELNPDLRFRMPPATSSWGHLEPEIRVQPLELSVAVVWVGPLICRGVAENSGEEGCRVGSCEWKVHDYCAC